MTIKQKLIAFLVKQKPMLVYTNGKEYIGLEEKTNLIGDKKYMQWCKTNASNAYDFNGIMYRIFKKRLVETLKFRLQLEDDWYFTRIQLVRRKP